MIRGLLWFGNMFKPGTELLIRASNRDQLQGAVDKSSVEDIRLWNGDSRGRWEGDTLVIETTNQNGKAWLDQRARFYTQEAHVTERLTLVDQDTLHYQATINDPNVYTTPFTIAFPYRRNGDEGYEMIEEACYETNEALLEIYRSLGFTIYSGVSAEEARSFVN